MSANATASLLGKALQHHQSGRLAEAESGYRAVLTRDGGHVDALYLLGILLHQSGRHADAIGFVQRAIAQLALAQAPQRPEFHNTLGDAFRAAGRFADATPHFERALALRPNYIDAQVNLANTFNASGRTQDAIVLLFDAVAATPTDGSLRQLLAASLHGVALTSASPEVRGVLRRLCRDDSISTQSIAGAVLGLVKGSDAFGRLVQSVSHDAAWFDAERPSLNALMHDDLLRSALPRIIVTDPDVERVLTAVRRYALEGADLSADIRAPHAAIPREFLCALASQCFNTEYAFACSEEERALVDTLSAELSERLRNAQTANLPTLMPSLALFALYQSLHTLNGWERLAGIGLSSWPEPFRPLVEAQLLAYRDEREIAAQLPVITPITDAVSQIVRDQYEANPYPRWITLERPLATTVDAFIRTLRREVPAAPAGAKTTAKIAAKVLVAGCGSGQQALSMAMSFSEAPLLAFDLSASSLSYASRMTARAGVTNVTFAQGDLLEFAGHDGEFTIISCSGVLHHLADPMAGWQRLVDALSPEGIMKVGLYATAARPAVEAARAFARDAGFAVTDDGIRACRQAILALAPEHPARGVLAFIDFFSLSGCRDLVMHVQERTYTIPEIAECLTRLQLRFLGFQLPHAVQARFQTEHGVHALLDLAAWDRFEQAHPATFMAMYQFWCCKD